VKVVSFGVHMVFQLVYLSYGQNDLTANHLQEIARHAAEKNQTLNITGILLYSEGNILQVLEGAEEVVENLFSKIVDDDRHAGAIVMLRKHADKREFGHWSMGFRAVEKTVYNDAVFILTKNSLEDSLPENRSSELDIMVRSYAHINQF